MMTPTAPSICPTALIISQFIAVTLAVTQQILDAERPTSNAQCRSETTGEGGIRTLGSLLGYGALAKRCFQPLSHLTKKLARISRRIVDCQSPIDDAHNRIL